MTYLKKNEYNSLDVLDRLNQLRDLKDGWLDGEGVELDARGLDWLSDSFRRLYKPEANLPFVYPMPCNGVQFEWNIGSQAISLEVDLPSRTAIYHRLDLDTKSSESRTMDLAFNSNWVWLCNQIIYWQYVT